MDTDPNDQGEDNIKVLREQAARAKELEKQLAETQRKTMFLEAGVDPSTKLGAMLFKTFDGTDAAALKAEATEVGYFGQPQAQPKFDPAEAEQQRFRQQLAGGVMPTGEQQTAHPVDEAYVEFHKELRDGTPRERAATTVMSKILSSGLQGDKRVLWNPTEHYAKAAEIDALGSR